MDRSKVEPLDKSKVEPLDKSKVGLLDKSKDEPLDRSKVERVNGGRHIIKRDIVAHARRKEEPYPLISRQSRVPVVHADHPCCLSDRLICPYSQ